MAELCEEDRTRLLSIQQDLVDLTNKKLGDCAAPMEFAFKIELRDAPDSQGREANTEPSPSTAAQRAHQRRTQEWSD